MNIKTQIMKSTLLVFCLSLLSVSYSFGQDTETRSLGAYDGIAVSAGIQAILEKGTTNEIYISAKGVDLDEVTTEVKRGVLKVGIDNKGWLGWLKNNRRTVEVVITYTDELDYIASSSGSYVEADHIIKATDIDVKTSSGANMDIELEARDVEIDVSSGARMELAGSAQNIDIDISSGASLDAYDLEAENVKVDGSSGSTAKVNANSSIDADVSSGANVKYRGNPAEKNIDKSSGGSVKKV